MGNLMGKSEPKSRITEQDRAVLGLKQQRDKLNQYKKRIEGNLDKERQVAKELLKHNKRDKARTLLKKKRYQENLLSQCDGQLDSIQQLIYSLEFAQVQLQVVENLKLGNESLKKLNSLMSVEEVERIMEETREAVEYQVSSETRILLKMVPFKGPLPELKEYKDTIRCKCTSSVSPELVTGIRSLPCLRCILAEYIHALNKYEDYLVSKFS